MRFTLILLVTFLATTLNAQNAYLYIEPYTSVAYDSTVFKVKNRFSNTARGSEEYHIEYAKSTGGKRFFVISSETNIDKDLSVEAQDKGVRAIGDYLLSDTTGRITSDKVVSHVNGFSYMTFKVQDKSLPAPSVIITGIRSTDVGLTKFMYDAEDANDVKKEAAIVESFLKGVKMYPVDQIAKEDSAIRLMYTVQVDSTAKLKGILPYVQSYAGIINLSPKPKHAVIGAQIALDGISSQTFKADAGKQSIEFYVKDDIKGWVTRDGQVVVLNSFGKVVHIPFSFKYFNR